MVKQDVLLLDCGNTAIKYRHGRERGVLASVPEVLAYISGRGLSDVLVASVSAQGVAIQQALKAMSVKCRRLRVQDAWQGLKLCYPEPERLGVDRWLTMVALAGSVQNLLIVDAGTALTLDVLDRDDQHRGGYILPGLSLMRRSLVDDTFSLPPVTGSDEITPGRSTEGCIANGTLLAAAGAVDTAVNQLDLPDLKVIWTGGDAALLRSFSRYAGQWQPNLVFDGMNRLLLDASYMETLT